MSVPSPIATSWIAQQAFSELSLRPLSSYADSSPEASDAAQKYIRALYMVLESYDWSFARRLVALPQTTLSADAEADADLTYAFSLPASCLVLRRVFPDGDPRGSIRWRREGNLVRADVAAVQAVITRTVTDEADFPALVQQVVALQLAALMAAKHAPTRAKRADIQTALTEARQEAQEADRVSASQHRLDGLSPSVSADWVAQVLR